MSQNKKKKKIARNDPCPCGSGKKYKKCCLLKEEQEKFEAKRLEEEDRDDLLFEDLEIEDEKEPGEIDPDWRDQDESSDLSTTRMEDESKADQLMLDDTALVADENEEDESAGLVDLDELDPEDRKLVEIWFRELDNKQEDPEALAAHFEQAIQEHPGLAYAMRLLGDDMFVLQQKLAAADQEERYLDILSQVKSRAPEYYWQRAGIFERDFIIAKILTGKTEELEEHLAIYKHDPFRRPDEMFEAIFFLLSTNCDQILVDLAEAIYERYCRSSRVTQRGCEELLTILVDNAFISCLRKDTTAQEFQELAETFKGFRIELADRLTSPDGLRQINREIFQEPPQWSVADCNTPEKLERRYLEVARNFMRFVHENKKQSWIAAGFYRNLLFGYLKDVVPSGKRPKRPFVFTRDRLNRTLTRRTKRMFFPEPSLLFGSLNSVYWFSEYLEQSGNLEAVEGERIRKWCREIHGRAMERLKSDLKTKYFAEFPLV
ncbi:MAG: SEC-C metal-binding domain-containing protein [Desulfovermiculus sp.]|nr:SEC-C metal-binding domain-containing protein [Desulfovermiculus sp.]